MRYRITMRSFAYGVETFEYDSTPAMVAGLQRLIASAIDYQRTDGIIRSFSLEELPESGAEPDLTDNWMRAVLDGEANADG